MERDEPAPNHKHTICLSVIILFSKAKIPLPETGAVLKCTTALLFTCTAAKAFGARFDWFSNAKCKIQRI